MAMNRYGRIYHSDHHHNTLRFPSADARQEFAEKFEQYHAKYDHDGEPPRFESIAAAEANRGVVHDVHEASIDGYSSNQIWEYHNNDNGDRWTHYEPPTTIAPPVIVVERLGEFVDSSTLTRHELSAIFMDMPDEDFQNLLKSVERDGFKDPIIRMIDTQVLDGWHRYRAAKELNLLRKLRFRQWKEQDEGDPAAFVMARNIERRHLNPGQRAQIVVSFNERYGMGRPSAESSPNGELKSRQELAKEAGVGERTIDRAVKVEKAGQAEQVIAGEKSASAVIEEMTVNELWKQINPAISEWKQAREGVGHASKTMFIKATLRWEGLPSDTKTDVKVLKELLHLLTTKGTNILEELVRKQLGGESLWEDREALAEKRKLALDVEHRMFNALDEVAPDWDYDDFIKAACDKHSDWGVTEFPDLDYTDIPAVWEERYHLLHAEITEPAAWIQDMLDKMAEPTESESEQQATEPPKQNAAEREANKLLNQKKQAIKGIWDKRKQAAEDWLGNQDNDLATYTDMVELEKAFVAYEEHAYCADAFQSAMRRRSETSFNICLEKTLASDVSLEDLEAEYKAVSTFALDILTWKKQEWIQELIDKNKAKADAKETEPEPEAEPDTEGLSKEFKQIFTLHTRFDRDIVDCEALGETYHLYVDDVESAMDDFQRELASLEHAVRKHLENDADLSVEVIAEQVEVDDIEVVSTMLAKIQLEEAKTDTSPEPDMDALWDAFNKRFPKWKAKYAESGYKENDLIQRATEAELFDALRFYRESERTGPVTAEEIQDVTELMQRASYPFALTLRNMLRDKHKQDLSEVDRCYAENQLRVVQNAISPLLGRLGADDMFHHDKEVLIADLYDVFLEYENVPTEKEMIVALLDFVDSILSEEIPETLGNEVLCPDDEADRQAMNNGLVTSVQ